MDNHIYIESNGVTINQIQFSYLISLLGEEIILPYLVALFGYNDFPGGVLTLGGGGNPAYLLSSRYTLIRVPDPTSLSYIQQAPPNNALSYMLINSPNGTYNKEAFSIIGTEGESIEKDANGEHSKMLPTQYVVEYISDNAVIRCVQVYSDSSVSHTLSELKRLTGTSIDNDVCWYFDSSDRGFSMLKVNLSNVQDTTIIDSLLLQLENLHSGWEEGNSGSSLR